MTEHTDDTPGDPGQQPADVMQEAVDATATAYAGDGSIEVEDHLRHELSSRGITEQDPDWVRDLAHRIRSGHSIVLGGSDGSIERRENPDGRV